MNVLRKYAKPDGPTTERLVLLVWNRKKIQEMADDLRKSKSTIHDWIKSLEADGLLTVSRYKHNGRMVTQKGLLYLRELYGNKLPRI